MRDVPVHGESGRDGADAAGEHVLYAHGAGDVF